MPKIPRYIRNKNSWRLQTYSNENTSKAAKDDHLTEYLKQMEQGDLIVISNKLVRNSAIIEQCMKN